MIVEPTLPETTPSEADVLLAQQSGRQLSKLFQGDRPLCLTAAGDDGETVKIPVAAARLLIRLLAEMAQGNAVTLIPIHAELTTQQAADLLGVSRPFVVKEIAGNRLPARKVGTHRRVLFQDLMAYKKRMDADRQNALDKLADLDQDLGLE